VAVLLGRRFEDYRSIPTGPLHLSVKQLPRHPLLKSLHKVITWHLLLSDAAVDPSVAQEREAFIELPMTAQITLKFVNRCPFD
jgi:hypothetical protein